MPAYTSAAASAGAITVTIQTILACCGLPASKLRPVQPTQEARDSWTTLRRGSGLICSSSNARRTARKLIGSHDKGAPPAQRPDVVEGRPQHGQRRVLAADVEDTLDLAV